MENGKVFIASMNLRGEWYPLLDNCKRINVTSAQSKESPYRLAFSPMTKVKNSYKGFYCFENYWQSGKRYDNLDVKKQLEWWKKQEKGCRRYPLAKGKKVLYAEFPDIDKKLDYIPSRKEVYVPEYFNLVKDSETIQKLKGNINKGQNYVVYDFDGPRTNGGKPDIMEVNIGNLRNKINDPKFPFGHGYVVAAALLDIEPKDYI